MIKELVLICMILSVNLFSNEPVNSAFGYTLGDILNKSIKNDSNIIHYDKRNRVIEYKIYHKPIGLLKFFSVQTGIYNNQILQIKAKSDFYYNDSQCEKDLNNIINNLKTKYGTSSSKYMYSIDINNQTLGIYCAPDMVERSGGMERTGKHYVLYYLRDKILSDKNNKITKENKLGADYSKSL